MISHQTWVVMQNRIATLSIRPKTHRQGCIIIASVERREEGSCWEVKWREREEERGSSPHLLCRCRCCCYSESSLLPLLSFSILCCRNRRRKCVFLSSKPRYFRCIIRQHRKCYFRAISI